MKTHIPKKEASTFIVLLHQKKVFQKISFKSVFGILKKGTNVIVCEKHDYRRVIICNNNVAPILFTIFFFF